MNIAIITGASSGLGIEFLKEIIASRTGIDEIWLVARRTEKLEEIASQYSGVKCVPVSLDLSDEKSYSALEDKLSSGNYNVKLLVNNAGFGKMGNIKDMPTLSQTSMIDVNCKGLTAVATICLKHMSKGGEIINVCSMMSELGRETVSAYAAAKGGLKMLTRNICSEYGAYNIQCNGLGPGYIETPQTAPLREIQPDGSRHPFDQFIRAKTPAERWGTPEDLMGPALFLASEASDFVNGQILYVDGGILAYIGKQP